MDKKQIVSQTADHVKEKLLGEGSGHDWWHIYRVWRNALHISKGEKANDFIVELAALLHDIADWKFNDGVNAGSKHSRKWLSSLGVNKSDINHVCDIVENVSFKGAKVKSRLKAIEGKIVQDADRLDAMGAIGIARCFAYGGHKGREIYNPDIKYELHDSFEKYKANKSPSINHFYEKLLLLKDLMNTKTGKKIAADRHKYMEEYLKQFYAEWEGEN